MTSVDHPDALPQGHRVQEFEFLSVLGVGGFGITYLAKDTLLGRTVAIKEYFPRDSAVRTEDHSIRPRSSSESENYTWGLERFLDEARTLAQLNHLGIILIYKYFEAHGSSYIVMEYIEGETLSERLKHENTLDESRLMAILNPLIEGLEQVHAAGYLHRDIKPMNILLRKDGSSVLIDFGSARQELGARSRSVTALVTPGYAPLEQYSTRGRQQGPWTDIYGLSAVAYRCITGTTPKDATERAQGEALTPASELVESQYAKGLLTAIDQGLSIKTEDRPQDLKAWRSLWIQKEKQQRYQVAAEQGDAWAQYKLGWMYFKGEGVPQDYAEAFRWYRLAAEQGDTSTQLNLDLIYDNGKEGVPRDYARAVKCYQIAAERMHTRAWKKYPASRHKLDLIHGDGVPQGYVEAVKWYRLAAEQGDVWAQNKLGRMYFRGEGVPQDYVEAVKWYRLAAEQGDAETQNKLGDIYYDGIGVPGDSAEAVKWYRMAAEHGHAEAQYDLGWMYDNGLGVPQDDAEAVKWYRTAAEQGNARAQVRLGQMYYNGEGVPQDDAEAVRWYRMAAEQGDAWAQYKLGQMYANGRGVAQDYIEAHKWYNLAALRFSSDDTGHSDLARKYRDEIEGKMTREAITTAQRLAREWRPKTWDRLKAK